MKKTIDHETEALHDSRAEKHFNHELEMIEETDAMLTLAHEDSDRMIESIITK